MEQTCNCLDICECLSGCCKKFCDSPLCEHDLYECICNIMCDFCIKEEIEELEKLEEEATIKKRKLENDENEYDADADSDNDNEESIKPPLKKMRFTIYTL